MTYRIQILHLLLAIAVMALLPCDMYAGGLEMNRGGRRDSGVDNYFLLSVTGGYSNLLTHDKLTTPYGFLGGLVGIGYEMHAGGFWWSIAGDLECQTSVIGIDKSLVNGHSAGIEITRWQECPHYLFAGVPLLLGYRNDDFYVGVGPKLLLVLYCHDLNNLNYTTSEKDHWERDHALLKNNLLNGAACFEIGGTVYTEYGGGVGAKRYQHPVSRTGLQLKLGFYAEYCFTNINATVGIRGVVVVDESSLDAIPILTSNSMTDSRINPFFAGIRLTLLYGGR